MCLSLATRVLGSGWICWDFGRARHCLSPHYQVENFFVNAIDTSSSQKFKLQIWLKTWIGFLFVFQPSWIFIRIHCCFSLKSTGHIENMPSTKHTLAYLAALVTWTFLRWLTSTLDNGQGCWGEMRTGARSTVVNYLTEKWSFFVDKMNVLQKLANMDIFIRLRCTWIKSTEYVCMPSSIKLILL